MKCEFDRPSGVECTFAADKQFDSDFDNDVVVIDSLADFLENKYDRVCVVNVNVNHSPNSSHFKFYRNIRLPESNSFCVWENVAEAAFFIAMYLVHITSVSCHL